MPAPPTDAREEAALSAASDAEFNPVRDIVADVVAADGLPALTTVALAILEAGSPANDVAGVGVVADSTCRAVDGGGAVHLAASTAAGGINPGRPVGFNDLCKVAITAKS
jgi:hypothetical protein